MPDPLVQPLALAVGWLLTYLVHSTALILAVWLVTRVVDLQPTTTDLLWKVAMLGGLATATGVAWSSAVGTELDVVRRVEWRAVIDGPDGAGEAEAPTWLPVSGDVTRIRAEVVDPTPECRAALRDGAHRDPGWLDRVGALCQQEASFEWYDALLLLWCLGGGLRGVMLFVRNRALGDLRGSLEPSGDGVGAVIGELTRGGDAGCVKIMSSPGLRAPCVFPGRTIGLPTWCEDELSHAQLRAVIAHELAHITRRDVAWCLLLHGVSAILWLQPLNRLALRRAMEAAELACDDWALTRTGERLGLATSISRVAEWATGESRIPAVVSIAGRDGASLSARVERILAGPPLRAEPVWLKCVVAAMIAGLLLVLPSVPAPAGTHASIAVEEGRGAGTVADSGPGGPGAVEHRVLIARVRSD